MLFSHENTEQHNARLRIFYTQAQGEPDELFPEIEKDIFSVADAKVYYEESEDKEILDKIKEMHIVVFPVTERMLSQENSRTMDLINEAIALRIPILPLLQTESFYREIEAAEKILNDDSKKLSFYDKKEAEHDKAEAEKKLNAFIAEYNRLFNNRQFLEKACRDRTALPFYEKLRIFLNSFLVDEAAEKLVKASFDAHIFMSYRKRDREDMQKLMQLIHNEEKLENVAIWYDEFLVPGRNFDEVLKDKLRQCDLMTLAITPNLLETKNYVHETEYPFAVDNNIKVLPIELTVTDRIQFSTMYPKLSKAVSVENKEELIERLTDLLSTVAWSDRMDDPQHTFYLGLAYLYGIDTNTDRNKGAAMIKDSAEQGFVDAIEKRAAMFMYGEVETVSSDKAIEWQSKAIRLRVEAFEAEGSFENAVAAGMSYRTMGDYKEYPYDDYVQAKKWFETALDLADTEKLEEEALCKLESMIVRFPLCSYKEIDDIYYNSVRKMEIIQTLADHYYKDYSIQSVIEGYDEFRQFAYYRAWKTDLEMHNHYTYLCEREYLEKRLENDDFESEKTVIAKRLKELYFEDFPLDPSGGSLQTPESIKKGLELLKEYPESPQFVETQERKLVNRLLLKEMYAEALAKLDEMQEKGYDSLDLFYGKCYAGLEDNEKAAETLEKKLEEDIEAFKQSKTIYDKLAEISLVIEDLKELEKVYKEEYKGTDKETKYNKCADDLRAYQRLHDQLVSDLRWYG